MSMIVQATTDQVPELSDLLERRRATGEDRYDEWWEGVYRVVTGPTPEHGELVVALGSLLHERAAARSLRVSAPLNIGLDKVDARVPDIAVFDPETERTSPAFLATALLVVEILSAGEAAGAKLPFYAAWGVQEYLEIDLDARTARLLGRHEDSWTAVHHSLVIELALSEVEALLPPGE